MRTTYPTILLLGLLLMTGLPGAVAHGQAHTNPALQGAHGLSPVPNLATLAGYVPSIVVVESGKPVAWTSLDVAHTFTEGIRGTPANDPCVHQIFSGSSAAVTFTLVDRDGDTVLVTGAGGEDEAICSSARVDGPVAVMAFTCTLHPWMQGVLIVYDADVTSRQAALHDAGAVLTLDSLRT